MALGLELVEDCQMALRTARFESEHATISGRTTQLLDSERSRVKHIEQLLLQFENDTLRSGLDQANEQLAKVTKTEFDARLQLHEICKENDRLQNIAQLSSHESQGLREKLASVGGAASESQNVLAEKIRLSKNLSGLQTEIERPRTHSASSHGLFAEKQTLERQLNTLEVQLEDEKRTRERSQAREIAQEQETASLSSQLEKARKELAEGLKEIERQEHNMQQQRIKWGTQRSDFESRIETLNRSLRSTKDQLQEAHKVQQRRSNAADDNSNEAGPRPRAIPPQRSTTHFNPDMTIATPGAVKTHKRVKQPSALPGDKSAFSITPYLSRTGGPPDVSVSSDDDMDELGNANVEDITMSPSKHGLLGEDRSHDSQLEGQAIHGKDLSRKTTKQKSNTHQLTSNKIKAKESSAKPSGHIDSDDQLEGPSDLYTQTVGHGPGKPKKRKLGTQRDRNLFEEEEEDELHEHRKPGRKLALGIGRNPALNSSKPPTASTSGNLPGNRGFGGFQAFSPLKRDKKRL